MNQKNTKEKKTIRMSSVISRSCGFLSRTQTGQLEIELFDRGDSAHSMFGNDVATIYTIAAEDIQALIALSPTSLPPKSPAPGSTETRKSDQQLHQLHQLAKAYSDIDKLIAALKASGIAFSTKFDSWA